jgi:hypothetical protein
MSWSATVYRLESPTDMAPLACLERDHDRPEDAKTARSPAASGSPFTKLAPVEAAP